MATIKYIGADGKEYSYELNDVDLSKIDTSGISSSIDSNTFINWTYPEFDVPISYGSLGGDPLYNLTLNSLSYLGNALKSSTEADYQRWTGLFKEEISKTLVHEANYLEQLVKRYNQDYGEPSVDISSKLQAVIEVSTQTNQMISGFASMASVSGVLTSLVAVLTPLAIITGAIMVIDTVVKTVEQPARQKQVLEQADKVQKMIESFKQPALIDTLRTFDKPAPKPKDQTDNTPIYIASAVFVYLVIIVILKRIKES